MTEAPSKVAALPLGNAAKSSALAGVTSWWRGHNRWERYLRPFLSVWIWGYIFLQLAVFDLDGWLISVLPEPLEFLIRFKFLVILLLATIINFVPRKRFWSWTTYVLVSPLVLLTSVTWLAVKNIAKLLLHLKSWSLFFAVINQFFEFVAGFKLTAFLMTVSLISTIVALLAHDSDTLRSASVALAAVVVALMVRRIVAIFRPSPIFTVYVRTVALILDYSRRTLIKSVKPIDVDVSTLTPEQFKAQYGNLSTAIALIEVCDFLKIRFGEYRSSKTAIATYLMALVALAVLTILLVATANYALYRADYSAFTITSGHSWFDFLYYSFGAITTQRITEIIPASAGARLLSVLETILGYMFFAGTLLSLYFGIKRSSEDADIGRAVQKLQEERQRMTDFVQAEYSLSLDDAIGVLERVQDGIVSFVNLLRKARGE